MQLKFVNLRRQRFTQPNIDSQLSIIGNTVRCPFRNFWRTDVTAEVMSCNDQTRSPNISKKIRFEQPSKIFNNFENKVEELHNPAACKVTNADNCRRTCNEENDRIG